MIRQTEPSLNPRTVQFAISGSPPAGNTIASVYLDLDHSVGASVYVTPTNLILGSVSIPIAPSPPTLALAGAAALAARRQRKTSV